MKVLLVNIFKIGDPNATGATLKHMLMGIPDVEYLQLCLAPSSEKSTGKEIVETVTVKPIDNWFLYMLMQISAYKRRLSDNDINKTEQSNQSTEQKSKFKNRMYSKVKRWLVKSARNPIVRINSEVRKCIIDFDPDLIYTIGGCNAVLSAAIEISEMLHINIVVHSMDDFYNTEFTENMFLYKWYRRRFIKASLLAYSHSAMSIGISEDMADEYARVFGIPFTYAMNCVESKSYKRVERKKKEKISNQFLIIFSGGLHGGRYQSICEVADIIYRINQNGNSTKLVMEVYTSELDYEKYGGKVNEYVVIYKYVPKTELMCNLQRANLLLHVESFNREYVDYFRLSMSTKIPEYMLSGVPILCYGSTEICSVRYIMKHDFGLVAENSFQLEKLLVDVLAGKYNMEDYTMKAYLTCKMEFEKDVVQARIQKCFAVNVIQGKM